MKTFAVYGAYKQGIQILEPTVFVGCQKESQKKEELLSVFTAGVEDALVEDSLL